MRIDLETLSRRTGLTVLDHLEQQVAIPVIDGLQAQGDLLIVPHHLVAVAVTIRDHQWSQVPATGLELLRSTAGGNPHTLVADPGVCQVSFGVLDTMRLALAAFHCTAPVYLLHPEHGATGFTPGTYVVRRQREFDSRGWVSGGGGTRMVAD